MAITQLINSLHPRSYQIQISPHKTKKVSRHYRKVYENQETDHQRIITLTFNKLWQSLAEKKGGGGIPLVKTKNIASDFWLQQNP